jgi:hypothetical protein
MLQDLTLAATQREQLAVKRHAEAMEKAERHAEATDKTLGKVDDLSLAASQHEQNAEERAAKLEAKLDRLLAAKEQPDKEDELKRTVDELKRKDEELKRKDEELKYALMLNEELKENDKARLEEMKVVFSDSSGGESESEAEEELKSEVEEAANDEVDDGHSTPAPAPAPTKFSDMPEDELPGMKSPPPSPKKRQSRSMLSRAFGSNA